MPVVVKLPDGAGTIWREAGADEVGIAKALKSEVKPGEVALGGPEAAEELT